MRWATGRSSSCPRRRARRRRTCCACAARSCGGCRPCPTPIPAITCTYSETLANELAETEPNGAIWANQFDNIANREGHAATTGPEIWQQTDGTVDGFTCAVGTGGTLAGVGMALKEKNPNIRITLADPLGAALYNFYANGELKAEGNSITEGIGQGRDDRRTWKARRSTTPSSDG